MATDTRPSIKTDLASRYATQKVGGAFDARNITTTGVDKAITSQQEAQFCTQNGFVTRESFGVSQFKDNGNNLSAFVKGLDTRKYSASAPG